jgi:hypothetical protein
LKLNFKKSFAFVLFVIIFILISILLHNVLLSNIRNSNLNPYGRWNRITKNNIQADLVIVGSSRAVYHFNPLIINSVTKMKSYNIGLDGQIINYQLPILKTYLQHNVKPGYVIISVDISFLWKQSIVQGKEYYVGVLNEKDIYDNLLSLDKEFFFYKYIPLYFFLSTRAPKLISINSMYHGEKIFIDTNKGFLNNDVEWNNDFNNFVKQYPDGYRVNFDSEGINDLEKLIVFCKTNNITPIMVFSPEYFEIYKYQNNRVEVKNIYSDIATKNEIIYLDYSDTCNISYNRSYFYNSQHLNYKGAKVFSRQLANDINKYILH